MRGLCSLVLLGIALSFSGCGDDDDDRGGVGPGSRLVGGACNDHADCKERCVEGKGYPGGMCTVSCGSDKECPSGSACIDDAGGICAALCGGDPDCDGFGPGWGCRDRKRRNAPGDVAVCRGD